MKFVELKKHVMSKDYYCCYNIYGDDSFLINSSLNFFFNFAINNNELSKTVLSTENFDAKNLLSILNTSSFLGGAKVVAIKDVDEVKDKAVLDAVLSYQKNPNNFNILIIISKNQLFDDKKTEIFNKNQKFLCNVDCNRLDEKTTYSWINLSLKEKNAVMQEQAKVLLFEYTNGYLSRIALELDKLISYASDREILEDDVKLLVQKELEYSVYELTENLSTGNSQKVYEILNDMMRDKKVAPSVFALIQNHFRRMFFSAITPKTNAQIAEMLNVKEFAVKKAKMQSVNFSKTNLKNIVSLCGELDYKIKTSQINYTNAVNYLVSSILSNNIKNGVNG